MEYLGFYCDVTEGHPNKLRVGMTKAELQELLFFLQTSKVPEEFKDHKERHKKLLQELNAVKRNYEEHLKRGGVLYENIP